MNERDDLDLLDLEDEDSLDELPEVSPFASPRPKKPWLLLGVGLLIIFLATYVIIRTIGSDPSSSMEVDLDGSEVVVFDTPDGDGNIQQPTDTLIVPPVVTDAPTVVRPVEIQPRPVQPAGVPVREVSDRKEVTFNPDRKPAAKPATVAPKPKPAPKQTATTGSWYVQFGSYSTRALAESAQRKIQIKHAGLFEGKQFVVLAAVLPDGKTTYRLRVAFVTSSEANGFCRNAKSDGLDCYVAR